MKVALFVPCYVDAFYPEVGIATLELLERLGCEVEYPLDQTCCGQPMAHAGCHGDAAGAEALFVRNFAGHEFIVTPSGSCAHHVRDGLDAIPQDDDVRGVRARTHELSGFLHDVLQVREFPWAEFPHRTALHIGCATRRAMRAASASEVQEPAFDKPAALLSAVKGLELVTLQRPDECCGFGGTFAVVEEPVSARMGQDKVGDQLAAGAEYVVTTDMSCAMHQQGVARRLGAPLKYLHLAQVLNGVRE